MDRQALCIGINNYPGVDMDLSGCVNDANNWRDVLMSKGFMVKTLTDTLATRENIVSNLRHMVVKAQPGDILVVQYSGHGTQIPDENSDEPDKMDEAWVPYDIYTNGPILDDTIWRILRSKVAGVQIIMISDSCHSGSVVRAFSLPHDGKKKSLPISRFIDQVRPDWDIVAKEPTAFDATDTKVPWPCLLLSGCQDTEYSYDAFIDGRPTGAFSYWAIRMLKSLPNKITYLDWHRAIRSRLPSKQHPQTPNILGSYQGDTIF